MIRLLALLLWFGYALLLTRDRTLPLFTALFYSDLRFPESAGYLKPCSAQTDLHPPEIVGCLEAISSNRASIACRMAIEVPISYIWFWIMLLFIVPPYNRTGGWGAAPGDLCRALVCRGAPPPLLQGLFGMRTSGGEPLARTPPT